MEKDNQILFSGISTKELIEQIRLIMQEEILKIKSEEDDKLISPAETCKIFIPTITKATLSSWTNKGLLDEYRIGGRVFYKKSEVLQKVKKIQKYKSVFNIAA